EIDAEAAKLMVQLTGYLSFDDEGHLYEHSVEVQIPFLQYVLGSDFKIVPIVVLNQTLDVARRIAEAYLILRREHGFNAVLLATSDLNHYEPYDATVKKDTAVLRAVETGDAEEVLRVIEEMSVTACGPAPLAAAVHVASLTGASRRILKYANSGDVTGEKSWVVGYPAISVG
ncbi:MAG TPA: AmmeMemoRadiSam system protein B, partial [Pyrodictium sp.]|nr:AmmeMemoRadiSam system protein B [Pyrodictium sp.]